MLLLWFPGGLTCSEAFFVHFYHIIFGLALFGLIGSCLLGRCLRHPRHRQRASGINEGLLVLRVSGFEPGHICQLLPSQGLPQKSLAGACCTHLHTCINCID